MNDLFMEISHFSDVHFTGKDVAYIMSLLITLLTAWFKLKSDNERQNEKIKMLTTKAEQYKSECKDEFDNAKKSRAKIRQDFEANIVSNNLVFTNRLDKIDTEIKQCNQSINDLNVSMSTIETKLDIIINK